MMHGAYNVKLVSYSYECYSVLEMALCQGEMCSHICYKKLHCLTKLVTLTVLLNKLQTTVKTVFKVLTWILRLSTKKSQCNASLDVFMAIYGRTNTGNNSVSNSVIL